jgi:tetratricopeptide (TPR) repeat protein
MTNRPSLLGSLRTHLIRRFEITACGAMLAGLLLMAGCSMTPTGASPPEHNRVAATQTELPTDSTEIIQARKVLKKELERTPFVRKVVFHTNPGEFRYISYIEPSTHSEKDVELFTLLSDSISASYSPGSAVMYPAWRVAYTEYVQMHQYYWLSSSWSQADAERVVNALKVLVQDARQDLDEKLAVKFDKFKLTCQSSRPLQQGPAMPEEARRLRVLAENDYRSHDLDKASDEYLDALTIYPCWPEGQFNVASILGELGFYTGALQHMRYYLELVPDAPDARANKDKMIVWQANAGH